MYIGVVPNLTIYLDRELWEAVRRLEIAPSPVCQRALRVEVKQVQRGHDREQARHDRWVTKQQEAK